MSTEIIDTAKEMLILLVWVVAILSPFFVIKLVLWHFFGIELPNREPTKTTVNPSTGYPMDEGASIDYGGYTLGDKVKSRYGD